MSYRDEFPDFDPATMPTIPAGFEDCSWHNNACPSFVSDHLELLIWIDYADNADRECKGYPRFTIVRQKDGIEFGTWSLATDDWHDIETAIAKEISDRYGITVVLPRKKDAAK